MPTAKESSEVAVTMADIFFEGLSPNIEILVVVRCHNVKNGKEASEVPEGKRRKKRSEESLRVATIREIFLLLRKLGHHVLGHRATSVARVHQPVNLDSHKEPQL